MQNNTAYVQLIEQELATNLVTLTLYQKWLPYRLFKILFHFVHRQIFINRQEITAIY
jgi:hypothetical protein